MSKEFRTIGTNTDPMSVQLYFDENNSIKWKIVFKEGDLAQGFHQTPNTNTIDTPAVQQPSPPSQENYIQSICEHIYIIGSKNKYQFKYNDIQLQIDESIINDFEIEYSSFDHLKYNKSIGSDLDKNISWKHYLKSMRRDTDVNLALSLNSMEISHINAMKEVIESAIAGNQNSCLIIIGSPSINQTNVLWFKKNKDKFEISNSKILLLWSANTLEQIDSKKIGKISNFKDPKAFVIKSQLYSEFLKKLNENKLTWESCLYQLIEENQFESYQIGPQIFY